MWESIKAFFGFAEPKEDPRLDPEDAKAYEYAAMVAVEQEKVAFPIQTLRGGVLPTDAKVEVAPFQKSADYESWVDVYEGPRGIGFCVNYETMKDGVLQRKVVNYGPEDYRDRDWAPVVDIELA